MPLSPFDLSLVALLTVIAKAAAAMLVGLALLSMWDLVKAWFQSRV